MTTFIKPYIFPPLYSKDKRGVEREWSVQSSGNIVLVQSSQVGGKVTTSMREHFGINKGSKNEMTPEQQANIEALRSWLKKLSSREYVPRNTKSELYVLSLKLLNRDKNVLRDVVKEVYTHIFAGGDPVSPDLPSGSSSTKSKKNPLFPDTSPFEVKTGGSKNAEPSSSDKEEEDSDITNLLPMLANEMLPGVAKCEKYFNWGKGVYVDQKLDGQRAIALRDKSGKVVMLSRKGKHYPHFAQIRAALDKLLVGKYKDLILDGEIYAEEMWDKDMSPVPKDKHFQLIQGACNLTLKKPAWYENQLGYYIFDCVSETFDQVQRKKIIESFYSTFQRPKYNKPQNEEIHLVKSVIVHSWEEAEKLHALYSTSGYEGIILRPFDTEYLLRGKRSLKMRKYKEFQDEEFEVIGAFKDPGAPAENFVWRCKDKTGQEFDATSSGFRETRIEQFKNYKKYVGKMLTVKYQGRSSIGRPRFPVAKGFRDDIDF